MTTETVTVTQADRDEASAYLREQAFDQKSELFHAQMVAGERDVSITVQAFARHRIEATRELEAERERQYEENVSLVAEKAALGAQLAEAREENDRLRKLALGEWFYPADGYESERCHYSPDEVIDYLDLEPGEHVVEVNVATSLPSIWCAVHVTDDEDADERYTFTEHPSEDEARAFLSRTGGEA